MVRRFYITGGNNVGDPAVLSNTITDPYFVGKKITGVFKEGFRYYQPGLEYTFLNDTVTIINGTKFDINEVFIVEVSSIAEAIYSDTGTCIEYYFPDIIKCVAAKVNTYFEARLNDPFSVFFDKGLYNQVGNDRVGTGNNYLTIWLVMPFSETSPRNDSYATDVICDIFIATETEANYTQQEREDINYHPRLKPAYDRFIFELSREPKITNESFENIFPHTKTFLPYWGGGDINGQGANNLWKQNADCIRISGLRVKKKNSKCCTFLSSF